MVNCLFNDLQSQSLFTSKTKVGLWSGLGANLFSPGVTLPRKPRCGFGYSGVFLLGGQEVAVAGRLWDFPGRELSPLAG